MSATGAPLGYARRLRPFKQKGRCGAKEKPDDAETVASKVKAGLRSAVQRVELLAELFEEARTVVFHTGAGVSTSAGIPDFRGVDGVWTREKKGPWQMFFNTLRSRCGHICQLGCAGHPLPEYEACWNNAVPTFAHMAITKLVEVRRAAWADAQAATEGP
eukprot:scaffold1087_cov198-Pinguiococcus_pyrenoidosus.AAC.2